MAIDLRRLNQALQASSAVNPPVTDPYLQTIQNQMERLRAVGVEPAEPDYNPSVLERIFNTLDMPARALQTAVFGEDRGESLVRDVVGDNRIAQAVGNFALRTLTDPLTYLSFGMAPAVKGAQAAGAAGRALQLRAGLPFMGAGTTIAQSTLPSRAVSAVSNKVADMASRSPIAQGYLDAGRQIADTTKALFQRFPITERNPALRQGVEQLVDVVRRTATSKEVAAAEARRLPGVLSALSEKEALDASKYLTGEIADLSTAPEKIQDAVSVIRQVWDDMYLAENAGLKAIDQNEFQFMMNYAPMFFPAKERKRLNGWLTDYFRDLEAKGVVERASEVGEYARTAQGLGDEAVGRLTGITNPRVANARQRFFRMFEDAEKAGFHPIRDVRLMFQMRALNSYNALANAKMVEQLGKLAELYAGELVTGSAEQAAIKGFQRLDNYIPGLGQQYWHPDVVRAVQRMDSLITNVDELNAFMKGAATLTNYWRRAVLTTPSFVLTQGIGNLANMYMKGMPAHVATKMYKEAWDITKDIQPNIAFDVAEAAFPKVNAGKTMTVAGKRFNVQDEFDLFHQGGGNTMRSPNAYFSDVNAEVLTPQRRNILDRVSDPFMNAAGRLDTSARFAVYMYNRGYLGMEPGEALADAFKYVFSSSTLSPTEQLVRSFAIPFYTFTRNQFPLLLKSIASHPDVYTIPNHLKESFMAAFDIEREELPEYARQFGSIPFPVGGNIGFVNPRLPTELLGFDANVGGALREGAAMVNPALRVPLELLSNRQFFSDSPIRSREFQQKSVLGGLARTTPEMAYVLQQVPWMGNISSLTGAVAQAVRPDPETPESGTLPESIPPNELLNILRSLGMRSFYNEVTPERQRAIFNMLYRNLLTDQVQSLQKDMGVEVPTIQELRQAGR